MRWAVEFVQPGRLDRRRMRKQSYIAHRDRFGGNTKKPRWVSDFRPIGTGRFVARVRSHALKLLLQTSRAMGWLHEAILKDTNLLQTLGDCCAVDEAMRPWLARARRFRRDAQSFRAARRGDTETGAAYLDMMTAGPLLP